MATFLDRDQYTKFSGANALAGLRADFEASLNPGLGPATAPPPTVTTPILDQVQPGLPQLPTEQKAAAVAGGGDYRSYARQTAQRAGIDPDQFERQIQTESGFDPNAGSPAGAKGIAQIVPKFHPGVDVTDPYKSLDYAADLMAQHTKTYGGDQRKALIAYNGGQGAVDADARGQTYDESRRYVDAILKGQKPLPQTPGDWFRLAKDQLNKPYEWGSKGGRTDFGDPSGFDCSGFVSFVYKNALGINLPAQTASAFKATREISRDEARPGDIVMWDVANGVDGPNAHMALYLGNNQIIQAGGRQRNVNIDTVDSMAGAIFRRADGADTSKSNTLAADRIADKLELPGNFLTDLRAGFESKLSDVGQAKDDFLGGLRQGFEDALAAPEQAVSPVPAPGNGFDPSHMQAATAPSAGVPQRQDIRDTVQTPQLTVGDKVGQFASAAVGDLERQQREQNPFMAMVPGGNVPDVGSAINKGLNAAGMPEANIEVGPLNIGTNALIGFGGSMAMPGGPIGKAGKATKGATLVDDALGMMAKQDAIKIPKIDPSNVGRSIERAITDKLVDVNRLGAPVEVKAANFQGATGAAVMRMEEAFKPVLKAAGDSLPETNVFVKFQHDLEVASAKGGNRAASAGVKSAEDAQAALTELEQRVGPKVWTQIKAADAARQAVVDDLLERTVTEGLVKREVADWLKATYPHYNPVKFVEAAANGALQGLGRRMSQNTTTLRRLGVIGHEGDTVQPIRAAMEAFVERDIAMQRNDLARTIGQAVESQGLGKRVSAAKLTTGVDIKTGELATVAGKKIGVVPGHVSWMEGGKRILVSVPKDIDVAVNALEDTGMHGLARIAMAANTPLRKGAVTLNTEFLVKNPVADIITTFITEGFEATARTPAGYLKAYFKTKSYRDMVKAGGGIEGFYGDGKKLEQLVAESGGTVLTNGRKLQNFITKTVNPLHHIESVGKALEAGPRVATFETHIRKGESDALAAFAARRVTIDFARSGSMIKTANAWVPFLNATVQGSLQVARVTGMNNASTILRPTSKQLGARLRLAAISGLVASTWLHNQQYKEEWADIPDYVKDQSAVIILGPGEKNENGVGFKSIPYIAIPLRQWGLANAILTHAFASADKADPRAWSEFLAEQARSFAPVSGDSAVSGIGGLLPAPARTALESGINRKLYTNKPIVGQQLQGTAPSQQFDEHTGEWAKVIASWPFTGGSPKGVEHFLSSMFAGVGKQIAQGSVDPTKGLSKEQGGQTLQHRYDRANEIVSRFQEQVADGVRQQPFYTNATRDRQVDLDQAAQAAFRAFVNEQVGIPATQTDTGLPQKYPGVPKRSAREHEIDEAITAYRAWQADPAHAKTPTGKQIALYSQYGKLTLPPYTAARGKQETQNRQTRRVFERLPDIAP